jgi:hypothetical protein
MSEAQVSDAMSNLVRFIIVLALLGVVIAMIFFVAGWIPIQPAGPDAPQNWCVFTPMGFICR